MENNNNKDLKNNSVNDFGIHTSRVNNLGLIY